MKIPNLVRWGLCKDFESGYNSEAINMMYEHIKRSPDKISKMIRETWEYIKTENKSNHVLCHFLYLLENEVEREWVKDISLDIVNYGLNYNDVEVLDETIKLTESWHDKDIFDLLYKTEIKEKWLQEYKIQILNDFDYFK